MGKYPDNTVLSRREIDRIIDKAFKVSKREVNIEVEFCDISRRIIRLHFVGLGGLH